MYFSLFDLEGADIVISPRLPSPWTTLTSRQEVKGTNRNTEGNKNGFILSRGGAI